MSWARWFGPIRYFFVKKSVWKVVSKELPDGMNSLHSEFTTEASTAQCHNKNCY